MSNFELCCDSSNLQISEQLKVILTVQYNKNGYPQSYSQITRELNLKNYEVEETVEELRQSGRIKITRAWSDNKIEFMD